MHVEEFSGLFFLFKALSVMGYLEYDNRNIQAGGVNSMGQEVKSRGIIRAYTVFFAANLLMSNSVAHAGIDRATSAGLAPHKALYTVKMISKKSGAQIANIHGNMAYEWQPSCDAWVSRNKFDMTYEYYEMPAARIMSDFSTSESFDGKTFHFSSERKSDDRLLEELRGAASTDVESGVSEALYSVPEDLSFELPEGTLFPIAHTLDVVEMIHTGKRFKTAVLFDGSDAEGPVEVNSFVGKPLEMETYLKKFPKLDSELLKARAWKLRLAFFSMKEGTDQADYEMSVVFHENGVISDMVIDYGDFSVRQTLTGLEKMAGDCSPDPIKPDKKTNNSTSKP